MNDSRHLLIVRSPPRTWREGLPCGNGKLGALLYGNVHTDTILVNDERFYFRSETPPLPDISGKLKHLRALMLEGDYAAANHLYEDTLRSLGYNPHIAIVQPGFDVIIKSVVEKPFEQYRRELDMRDAEARVIWSDGEREFTKRMFVSHVRNFIGFQLSASEPGSISLDIRLDLHDRSDAITQDGRPMEVPLSADFDVSTPFIVLRGAETSGEGPVFGGVLRAIAHGGEVSASEDGLVVRGADSVELQVSTFLGKAAETLADAAKSRLSGLNEGYDYYFRESREQHRAFYETLELDLGGSYDGTSNEVLLERAYGGNIDTALVEKLFHYGRYLMVSSSVPGSLPAHLQGKWNGDYEPPWQCFYMANENLQMNYWQCLRGNLFENLMPVFDYYESLIQDFRITARNLFGCRGILIPAATAPDSGLPKILHAQIMYWTGAAGWIARHFYEYFLYSGDFDFLRNRALPFMLEVARFYEDFLVDDGDGKLAVFPSVSPENCPAMFVREWRDGGPIFISINATMEVAICRELFRNLIEGAEAAGLYSDSLSRWRCLLKRLPEYRRAEDGTITEWIHPDFPDHENHRHLSHLYPFFPGDEFSPEDPKRSVCIQKTLSRRLTLGLQVQTGWSLVHMANIYARFGDGNQALYCLDLLARSCIGHNFFSYHNDDRRMGITMSETWGGVAPFQIDANMGIPAAILEMLVASKRGQVTLLPGLPSKWWRGRVSGLRAVGGLEVGMEWNLRKGRLDCAFSSPTQQEVRLFVGRGTIASVHDSSGLPEPDLTCENNSVRLCLKPHQHINLRLGIDGSSPRRELPYASVEGVGGS